MTFWYESGSADPYNWPKDLALDPDPDIFVSGFEDAKKIRFNILLVTLDNKGVW